MKEVRVYADTSVFGGVFDDEFGEESRAFFEQVKSGQFVLVTSAVVEAEMATAPAFVQEFFEEMLGYAQVADVTSRCIGPARCIFAGGYCDSGLFRRWAARGSGNCFWMRVNCELEFSPYRPFSKNPTLQCRKHITGLCANRDLLASGGDPV